MSRPLVLFWFRRDLRLTDNPGLCHAAKEGLVLPLYILDETDHALGGASKWGLYQSLRALSHKLGGALRFYKGNPKEILEQLITRLPIQGVYWNRCYEPHRVTADAAIKSWLKAKGLACHTFNGSLLWEPWEVLKKDETPYKVFTPFYKAGYGQNSNPRHPLPKPKDLMFYQDSLEATDLHSLLLLPQMAWDKKLDPFWSFGEEKAQQQLSTFLEKDLSFYKEGRDFPAQKRTSILSPALHFGEISPNQVWHATEEQERLSDFKEGAEHFKRELVWREFAAHTLYHYPSLPFQNFDCRFDAFPWRDDKMLLKAWQQGQTGYPLVDAGMRELWETGTMHNRVRMVVGSFLVKNLLIHWRYGVEWFWDCLVDADLASNSFNWQWVAGCGLDAAPYFRIFNPTTQGETFDPEGSYTKRWVPELRKLPHKYLFKPWQSPSSVLTDAGIVLGKNYPYPLVDLSRSKDVALKAFASLKKF